MFAAPAAVSHQRADRHAAGAAAARAARGLGGAAGLPRPGAVQGLLAARGALPDRGDVRGADGLRHARDGARGRGHQPACGCRSSAPRRCRRAVADAFLARTGVELCEGYGLTEAHVRERVPHPRRGARRQRRPAPALPAGARRARRVRPLGAAAATARSARCSSRAPTSSPATSCATPDGPRPSRGDKVRDGWLNTGDLGSVDADGYVRLVGRAKDLIIRGGHNIDPAVIEDALLEHPAVTAAAAVGRPDAHAGEVPVAYVTLAAGAAASEDGAARLGGGARPRARRRAQARRDHRRHPADRGRQALQARAAPPRGGGRRARGAGRPRDGRHGSPGRRTGVVVSVRGGDRAAVRDALAPFGFAWETADQEGNR